MSQEEKDSLKSEIVSDLSKATYRMTINKIIALIGCTIMCCSTVGGSILYISNRLEDHTIQIQQHSVDINGLKNGQESLWRESSNLQGQINQHITEDSKIHGNRNGGN